jgi:hypothetical protein
MYNNKNKKKGGIRVILMEARRLAWHGHKMPITVEDPEKVSVGGPTVKYLRDT